MRRRLLSILFLSVVLAAGLFPLEEKPSSTPTYRQPSDIAALLKGYAVQFPQIAKVLTLSRSRGLSDLLALELAADAEKRPADSRPAILVAANLEGSHLIGTEAALKIAGRLCEGYGKDQAVTNLLDSRTIYIAPLLNPDAAHAYFAGARYERKANARPVDEDTDDAFDEDGFEDLNKDGWITDMRVKDPEGTWIPDPKEPRLMRKADPLKAEKGLYAVYSEGLDNDGDGRYNEDPPGGVELDRNFPHDFEYQTKAAGLWPVSEDETRSLAQFLFSHPRIALVLGFSSENTILNLQQTGQARAGADRVKLPKMYAQFLGLEPDQEYTMKEIMDALKGLNIGGGFEITEDMVAMMLGLGPAVAIDHQDLPLFEAVQKDYKDALKAAKLEYPEKRAKAVGKGSFAAFCYYQYGVPVFSTDVWAVPEPKKDEPKDVLTSEKIKSMSNDEFIALGEEKIEAFLKSQGAPPNFKAAMVINMIKSGQITTAKMAEMMDKMPKKPGAEAEGHPDTYLIMYSDTAWGGQGFVNWTPFKHPTLGDVEIGGFVPYLRLNPRLADAVPWIDVHADFYLKLMAKVPEIKIRETRVKPLGEGLYEVSVFVTSEGWLPTSTAQGRRAMQAWPIRVALKTSPGQALFSGRAVEFVPFLAGGGETRKIAWTVRAKKGSTLKLTASSPRLGTAEASVTLD